MSAYRERHVPALLRPALQEGMELRHQINRDPDRPLPLGPRRRRLRGWFRCRGYCTGLSIGGQWRAYCTADAGDAGLAFGCSR